MASGRRFLAGQVQLAGRSWEDAAPQLEELLKRLWESEADGIPAGFEDTLAEAVEPGAAGDAGTEDEGWAAADHAHPVGTGAPGGLANANVEGASDSVPRLDHAHKRDVRVKNDGVDVGTRNALNLVDGGLVEWTVADDAGNDEIDVTAGAGAGSVRSFGMTVAGDVPSVGVKGGYLTLPFSGTITGWSLTADTIGSIVVDIWKDTWANFPPTVADSITGSEKPTLSSQQNNQDLTLSTWSTSVVAGEVVAFNVESAATLTAVTLVVWVRP